MSRNTHKTLPEVVKKVDELLETCTDRQIAERLNELGYTNWKGQSFTHKKVIVIRAGYHLKNRFERLRARGMLTADELADQLGVCATTIYHWGHDGFLCEHRYGNGHRCLYEALGEVILVKARAVAIAVSRRSSSLRNQPHKVQYETYALSRGFLTRAGRIATP